MHVVNTTDSAKAVKVRFLEGKNSQEVLDFNLYLSPKDEWTGVITRTETGAQISSQDTSCIAPRQLTTPEAFRTTLFSKDSVKDAARTREGYLEIIEMGDLPVDVAAAATHTSAGVPANCALVRTFAGTVTLLPASGGLYGFNTVINVEDGLSTTVDAVALDDFWSADLASHTATGTTTPSLNNASGEAHILNGNEIVNATFPGDPVDSVSAVLARTNVINDYVVGLDFDALTDWVITFPTKRFYVNPGVLSTSVDTAARAPFSQKWLTDKSQSCDTIGITYYDREEKTEVGEGDFSPLPDTQEAALCNEVNTISIVANGGEGGLLGAAFTNAQIELAAGFNAGWMDIGFISPAAETGVTSLEGVNVGGLPVIGFALSSFTNGTLEVEGVNVLSNYGGSSAHKGVRAIFQPL
ncbi:hypothetical protein ebA1598 [Aromatoleum aromaticum EbN1]|uniref:Uncharacterized protein n=1 Tax=Aromatoleum aromaticum (strain DSM 19018 / LMG 30748 / EbN1) TaxID=76114 RepID=Q5P6R6_AROAE|nr:hypothetical protein ebA1598 [Aromatoleum aromaticum EbN1]